MPTSTTYDPPSCETLEATVPYLPRVYKGANKRRLAAIQRIINIYLQCTTPEDTHELAEHAADDLFHRKVLPEKRYAILGVTDLSSDQIYNEHWVGTPSEKRLGFLPTGGRVDSSLKYVLGNDRVEGLFKTGSQLNKQLITILGTDDLDKFHKLFFAVALHEHLAAVLPTAEAKVDLDNPIEIELTDLSTARQPLNLQDYMQPKVTQYFGSPAADEAAPSILYAAEPIELYQSQALPTIEEMEDVAKETVIEITIDEDYTPPPFRVAEPDVIKESVLTAPTVDITLSEMSDAHLAKKLAACKPEIDKLLKRHLCATVMREKFDGLVAEYLKRKAAKKEETIDPKREQWLCLLRGMTAELKHYGEPDRNHSYSNRMRQAILYLIMVELEEEQYALSKILRAPNSELYRLCQEALNITCAGDVPLLESYNYNSILEAFFRTNIDFACAESMAEFNKNKNFSKFSKDLFGKLKRRTTDEYTRMENGELNSTLNYLRIAIDYGVGFILTVAIGAASNALIPIAGPSIVGRGIGALASSYYGYLYGRAATETVTYLENAVATTVAKKVGKSITSPLISLPGNVVYYTLNLPFKVCEAVANAMQTTPVKNFGEAPEFITMLLSLPDKHFSAEKKEILRNIDLRFPDPQPVAPVALEEKAEPAAVKPAM